MPRIAAHRRIPAHVTLRSLREARGLSAAQLAERLTGRGITVNQDFIYDVELGRRNPNFELRVAWADLLGIGVSDIRTGDQLRELVTAEAADAGGSAVGEHAA